MLPSHECLFPDGGALKVALWFGDIGVRIYVNYRPPNTAYFERLGFLAWHGKQWKTHPDPGRTTTFATMLQAAYPSTAALMRALMCVEEVSGGWRPPTPEELRAWHTQQRKLKHKTALDVSTLLDRPTPDADDLLKKLFPDESTH